MLNRIDICIVCLRTDLSLKRILDLTITDFHEELCDFSYSSQPTDRFCIQCEHLLIKLYNFKVKCVKAKDILQKWNMKKLDRKPLDLLHTLLPQSSLGLWTPNNANIFSFQEVSRECVLTIDNILQPPTVYIPSPIKSEPVEILNSNEDIKLEDGNDSLQFKEIETVLIVENQSKHQDNDHNYAVSDKCNIQQQKNDNFKLENCLDDSIQSSDDDTEIDNILDDCSLNNNIIHEVDKGIEKTSIDSDDDKFKETKRYPTRRDNAVAESANDDDDDDDDETETEDADLNDDGTECNIANKIITNMENINAGFDSKNDDFEKIVIQTGNTIQNKEVASIPSENIKKQLTLTEFAKMFNIDGIEGNCRNMIGDNTAVPVLSSIGEATRRALKKNLKAKFENCRELKLQSGDLIDKEHILNCLDGKVSEFLAQRLWRNVKDKKQLTPEAIKILGLIQDQYDTRKYESVFEIEYLHSTEAKKKEFQRRETYQWYLKSRHKCEICYTVFRCGKHLETHIKMYHVERPGDKACGICGIWYKERRVHKHAEAVYKCKLCPLVTYHRANMKNHYDQHKGKKYRCEPCNKTFSSYSAYKTHRGYEHRRSHTCTVCGRTFETEDILNAHKKTHLRRQQRQPPTDGSTSVKCDECKLSFPSQQVYERHIRFTHGTWYWTRTGKKQRKGYKKPVYTCPVCKATGATYGWLVSHGRLEHKQDLSLLYANKRNHLCDYCGRGFHNKYALRDHLNIHTGERPFACDKCPKRFHSSMKLTHHQLYHGPPKYVCEQCGKKFHTPSNHYNHVQIHIGIRRHECNSCGKRFISAGSLNEHIRGVHMNVRREKKRRGSDAGVAGAPAASGVKRQKALRATSTEESSDSD